MLARATAVPKRSPGSESGPQSSRSGRSVSGTIGGGGEGGGDLKCAGSAGAVVVEEEEEASSWASSWNSIVRSSHERSAAPEAGP